MITGRLGVVSDHFIGVFDEGGWRRTAEVGILHAQDPTETVSLAAGPARDGGVWIATEHASPALALAHASNAACGGG